MGVGVTWWWRRNQGFAVPILNQKGNDVQVLNSVMRVYRIKLLMRRIRINSRKLPKNNNIWKSNFWLFQQKKRDRILFYLGILILTWRLWYQLLKFICNHAKNQESPYNKLIETNSYLRKSLLIWIVVVIAAKIFLSLLLTKYQLSMGQANITYEEERGT